MISWIIKTEVCVEAEGWGRTLQGAEHSKGLSNQADVELDMINAISAADIALFMSSSQAIVNWLIALGCFVLFCFSTNQIFHVSLMYDNTV